jgi:hypothetical protein
VAPGRAIKEARIKIKENTTAKPMPKRFMVPPLLYGPVVYLKQGK